MKTGIKKQKKVYLALIVYSKAFDFLDYSYETLCLWNKLVRMGAPQYTIQLLRDLYKDKLDTIKVEHGNIEWFGCGVWGIEKCDKAVYSRLLSSISRASTLS